MLGHPRRSPGHLPADRHLRRGHPVTPNLLASTGANNFVVTPDPTAITYTGATTAINGQSATLSGILTITGNALPDKPVTLTLGSGGSAQSCSATTDAVGSASCAIASVNQTVGSVPVTRQLRRRQLLPVLECVAVTVAAARPTTLTVNAATGEYNVATTVSGVLTNSTTSAPIAGEPVP